LNVAFSKKSWKRVFESWKTLELGLCKSWKVLEKVFECLYEPCQLLIDTLMFEILKNILKAAAAAAVAAADDDDDDDA